MQSRSIDVQRRIGPHWLVGFCDATGVLAVSVSLSALATDLEVTQGLKYLPDPRKGDFLSFGVPIGSSGAPMSPEQAAQLAATETKALISEVPDLQLPPFPLAPQLAMWHLQLDRSIALRGVQSGKQYVTSEVYVGYGNQFGRASLYFGDPLPEGARALEVSAATERGPATSASLRRIDAQARALERVSTVNGGH